MWLAETILIFRILGLYFIMFNGVTTLHLYPFDPTHGEQEILQTWQSWVFLFVSNFTLLFFVGLLAFAKLDSFEIGIIKTDFFVRCVEWLDEILTGSRYFGVEWISYNNAAIAFFCVYIIVLEWKKSSAAQGYY